MSIVIACCGESRACGLVPVLSVTGPGVTHGPVVGTEGREAAYCCPGQDLPANASGSIETVEVEPGPAIRNISPGPPAPN